jgi:hypothetical protein
MNKQGASLIWVLIPLVIVVALIGVYSSRHVPPVSKSITLPIYEFNPPKGEEYRVKYIPPVRYVDDDVERISIATWNLKIFGRSKIQDSAVMDFIFDTIAEYDIVAIQEIRDSSGISMQYLCDTLVDYSCVISERTGYSNIKEQYAFVYKKKFRRTATHDYSDLQDEYSRPPFLVEFKVGNWTFSLVTMHTVPDDTPDELDKLDDLLDDIEGDVILLGDLNADCTYYNTEKEDDFTESWLWLVPDDEDTTVSGTDCAYDRFIVSSGVYDNYISYGVERAISSEVSDHYLVWAEFTPCPECTL